ncbi:hypothetical protein QLY40_21245, partial [Cronobacter sakazakii]|nr:hypothetical protein [Cronobacter sakazakii]
CGVVRKGQRGIGCEGSSVIDCLWPNTKMPAEASLKVCMDIVMHVITYKPFWFIIYPSKQERML